MIAIYGGKFKVEDLKKIAYAALYANPSSKNIKFITKGEKILRNNFDEFKENKVTLIDTEFIKSFSNLFNITNIYWQKNYATTHPESKLSKSDPAYNYDFIDNLAPNEIYDLIQFNVNYQKCLLNLFYDNLIPSNDSKIKLQNNLQHAKALNKAVKKINKLDFLSNKQKQKVVVTLLNFKSDYNDGTEYNEYGADVDIKHVLNQSKKDIDILQYEVNHYDEDEYEAELLNKEDVINKELSHNFYFNSVKANDFKKIYEESLNNKK